MLFVSTSVSSLPERATKVSWLYLSLGRDSSGLVPSDIGNTNTKRCADGDMCDGRYQSLIDRFSIRKAMQRCFPASQLHYQPHTSLYSFLAEPFLTFSPLR